MCVRECVCFRCEWVNPFTLRVHSECIICCCHTFENNFGIKRKFAKYLTRVVAGLLINISRSNFYTNNAYVSEIFPKSSGLFWPL